MKRKDPFKLVSIIPVYIWMVLFIVIPLVYVFLMSFMRKGTYGGVELGFSIQNYLNIFQPTYLYIFGESLLLAFITTAICLVIAYPFTYFVSQKTSVPQTIFMALVIIPFMISSLIRIYSWITLLRKNGIINTILIDAKIISSPLELVYNNTGIVIGMVYTLLPFMILPLYSSLEKLDNRLIEAGSDLGAKKSKIFSKIILPLTAPGVFAGSVMVFIPTLGYFFVSDMLGGSKSILIGNLVRNQFMLAKNWPMGAAISIFLIVITIVALQIYSKLGGKLEDLGVR